MNYLIYVIHQVEEITLTTREQYEEDSDYLGYETVLWEGSAREAPDTFEQLKYEFPGYKFYNQTLLFTSITEDTYEI